MVGKVARVKEEVPSRVVFETEYHELVFTEFGLGIAVLAPEWDGMALILTKADVEKLLTLCNVVVSRP
jgi:hypothetical protein